MFEIFKPSGKFEIFLLRFLPGFSEGKTEFCPGLGSPKGVPFPGSGNSGNSSEEFSGPRARARRSEISPYVSAARDVCADPAAVSSTKFSTCTKFSSTSTAAVQL